jgi:hypothetical protein
MGDAEERLSYINHMYIGGSSQNESKDISPAAKALGTALVPRVCAARLR